MRRSNLTENSSLNLERDCSLFFQSLAMTGIPQIRHCEEHSDEAISFKIPGIPSLRGEFRHCEQSEAISGNSVIASEAKQSK